MHLLQKKWGGREAQDGEHMYTHGWLMWMYGKNHENKQTNKHKHGLVEFSSLWRRLLWVGLQHTQGSERWLRENQVLREAVPLPGHRHLPLGLSAPRLVAPILKHRPLGAQGHGWCLAWSRFPRHHLDTGRRHLLMLSIPPLALASLSF